MKLFLVTFFIGFSTISWNQVLDDFSDGDFTSNPTWSGNDAVYQVNASQELQLNNSVAATSYLSLPHSLASLDNKEWSIKVRQTFSGSSSNFGRVYLTATSADLSTNPDGFYLQFGEAGSTDAVRLFKSVSSVSTQICATPDGLIANSFSVRVKVVRDNLGQWNLYVDATGGTNYGAPYSGTDAATILGSHFGVMQTYTSSNANKFYYDDVYVGNEIIDAQAPLLNSVSVISATQLDLLFSEPVSGSHLLQPSNYILNPALAVNNVVQDAGNQALIHLSLAAPLTNGQSYAIVVDSIEDIVGNDTINLVGNFVYLVGEAAVKGDLIISEIMVDPSPIIGLPEQEFVEIFNRSSKYIDLTGWKIGDLSADGTIGSGFIFPGQYIVLCASSSLPEFPGAYSVTSFPSFNNSSDDVVLKTPSGIIIDKISYTDAWYNDPVKKNGGYTLELINPNDPCSDASNWSASTHVSGGTPGAQNAIFDTTPDTQTPTIQTLIASAPNFLEITFNEGMDSTSLVNSVIFCSPSLTVQSIYAASYFTNQAIIQFNETIMESTLYNLQISSVSDCWMNTTSLSGNFALPSAPAPGDLVINEILFDPLSGGSDFVEWYNKSQKVINLNGLTIMNYKDDTLLLTQNFMLFPDNYVVLTPDSMYQKNTFSEAVTGTFYKTTLPSLNTDSSSFMVYYNNVKLDQVSYSKAWHFQLLDDTKNKSLERIDPAGPSNDPSNWHTAAESIGFATPGKINSQRTNAGEESGVFSTTEPIFSPDNDGFQDVIRLEYKLNSGMIGTLQIFDNQGRPVKTIFKSELLAQEGFTTWDGIMDNGQKAPIGVYIAVLEAFSEKGGKVLAKKLAFTLAGRLD